MSLEQYIMIKAEGRIYKDRAFKGTDQDYKEALEKSSTVYAGGFSHDTKEESIWMIFSICGEIRRVIMGINRTSLIPCGFCFVEFYSHSDAKKATLLNGFIYNGMELSVNIDSGFVDGRQYGRGFLGGRVKDDKNRRNEMRNRYKKY